MHPMLNIAIRAARKAGNVIIKSYENPSSVKVDAKGENDFVTNVDRAAESLIIETIKKAYPDHTIISEESGLIKGQDTDIQWIIDPIDGTTNFIKGIPHCAVSIAVRIKGRTEVGVVYNPMLNELFTASRGQGAQLNGYRIRTNLSVKEIQGSVFAIAFPHKMKQYSEYYFNVLEKMFTKCSDFRRNGSAALDFCYIASGRLDGYFEIGLKPWDIAAGELILREAGGIITDFNGGNNYLVSGNVVAGSPKIVKEFLSLTQNDWPERLKC
ncbi:inositol-1-monophosphatase [Frischella sp. Ac48]|uniref:Inositol-1-monophosphatase n=1 Tax=Frischella japonica TaxID=2741544 RepID=A0ABR7QV67_9GAMM|nr:MULTISPECIES: inositol-1-monophosphatase [Frischella]MBC9130105.1 inositol-1-monophosphatase [Frischella japonica]MBX4133089.1 inositol-1-monophosphatase [Frischella sp. Ac48]